MVAQIGTTPITLGALQLSVTDSAGVEWGVTGVQGWDSPGLRASLTSRQADHGAWWSPVYLDPRPITLTGLITAPDRPTRDAAIEQLIAAVALTDTVLTVGESIPKQAAVRRSGQLLIAPLSECSATYSALVTAADPRRYDVNLQSQSTGLPSTSGGLTFPITFPITFSAVTSSGFITATNSGSFETRPVFTVTGPVTAPQIFTRYADGHVDALLYSSSAPPLGVGEQLVIDTDAHTVMSGGASRRRWMTGPWPTIPPGQTVQIQFGAASSDPTALLTATWRSAWM